YHLPALLDGIDVPYVVICEPIDEFVLASLHAIDWQEMVERCDSRGTAVHLVCAPNPAGLICGIGILFADIGGALVDGSYFYQHYPSWTLDETKRRFINELPKQMIGRGYFEDERKMIWNTATNLHRHEFHLIEGKFRPRGNIPVFLIGAGPSFDQDAEFVEKWREHVILFSSGSALQPLLKRGIIPDYHTELENSPILYEKLKHIMAMNADRFPEGKFTGIRLVASTTINPRLTEFFDDIYFYFRDSVTSTTSFGRDYECIYGVAPTVANTSLAIAAILGFGDTYMFGFDCGWRDGANHHAKDTIWYTSDTFKTQKMSGDYTIPGNFGGEFQSDMVFDWCRNLLEEVISQYRVKAYNCSDGVMLTGATPKVAEAIELPGPPIDRAAVLEKIQNETLHFKKGAFFADVDMATYVEEIDEFERLVMPLFDQALEEDLTFHQFHERLWTFLKEPRFHSARRLTGLFVFTTGNEMKLAAVLINRIASPEVRQKVTRDFFRDYKIMHDEMIKEGRTIIAEATTMFAGGPEPWWTAGLPTTPGTSY
ncbi:MAG: DUF115 domain-containing protein, partial [Magnetospirillum sp.]|nr:DUF115 domain-containing protein [Magnetospirillum sp.]